MAAPPRIIIPAHPAFGEALKGRQKKLMSGSSGRCSKEPLATASIPFGSVPCGSTTPVYAPDTEHIPPDTVAAIFWLKNGSPAQWRNAWQLEHLTGKYVIADRPLNGVDRTQVSRRALGEVGSGDAGGLRG